MKIISIVCILMVGVYFGYPKVFRSEIIREPSSVETTKCDRINYPIDKFENGFVNLDILKPYVLNDRKKSTTDDDKVLFPLMCPPDIERAVSLQLQPYDPLFTFVESKETLDKKSNNRLRQKIKDEPWVGQNLDITKIEDSEKLANILIRYVYQGWFDVDQSPDKSQYEKQFRSNSLRTWCHTPWLNVTERGREAIHGLTKEFPIRSTHVYKVPAVVEGKESAVTWGLSFFNDKVCSGYKDFFNEKNNLTTEKNPENITFVTPNGGVSFKLLFNSMPNWQEQMKGQWTTADGKVKAYNWWAHVSHAKNDEKSAEDESIRQISNIPLVQIDISIKDNRLLGTKSELKSWVMLTYYFDPNFVNSELADLNIPESLKHMRPVGLQYGLDEGQTHIFKDAHNNHVPPQYAEVALNQELPTELDKLRTRLNGPVDNIKSSCLGCHASSGFRFNASIMNNTFNKPPMTFFSEVEYKTYWGKLNDVNKKVGHLDFNMQLDKAVRNFINRNRDKKDKIEDVQK